MRVFTVLSIPALLAIAASAYAADTVSGTYRVNGVDAKLAFVVAHKASPFFDHPRVELVFTEKDASQDAKACEDAKKGQFGQALCVSIFKDDDGWNVLTGDLFHAGIKNSEHAVAFGSTGFVNAKNLSVDGGRISGHLVTDPGQKVGEESLDLDLNFQVKQP